MPADFWSLLGMLLAVVVILAAAWWVTTLVARQGTLALPGLAEARSGGEFCVLRQIPISRTERLVLVRLNSRVLLLGVAQGGVSLLAELAEEDAAAWLQNKDAKSEAAEGSGGVFRRFLH